MSIFGKISRRNFLKMGAVAASVTALSLPAKAEEPENCIHPKITSLRNTQFGLVQGAEYEDGIVWYGIPYGAAPVGELRWQEPVDPDPWSGVKDCSQVSEVAYQYSSSVGVIGTEDCLKLDVYATPNAYKQPVLVFIHGGNNQTGNSRDLIGKELVVKDDCVYVSIDYRLGLFGFNCLPALQRNENETGNYTLLDIAKALDWVHDNIKEFGGDPENVTVSGFSGGGRDVMALLVSEMFAGRFQKAIAFSGGMTIADLEKSQSQIAGKMAPLAVEDGLFASAEDAKAWLLTDAEEVREWLYSLDSSRICPLFASAGIRMSAFPHLYGDDVVLPKEGFQTKEYNSVPLLMLTGSTEFSMFAGWDRYFYSAEMKAYPADEVQSARHFAIQYGSDMYRIFNAQCSAETMYEKYNSDIYICQIDYGSETSPVQIPEVGAFHGIFIPMLSSENKYASSTDFSVAGYQSIAEKFNRYLKNFMLYGNPNGLLWSGVQDKVNGRDTLPEWEAWTPDNKLSMVMDASLSEGFAKCQDVSTTYDAIMDRMEADTSVSEELKLKMIRNVMNGRWFSDALDARYGNPSLWK